MRHGLLMAMAAGLFITPLAAHDWDDDERWDRRNRNRDYRGYRDYGRDRYDDRYGRGRYGQDPVNVVRQVRSDLQSIGYRARTDHHEIDHFRRADAELRAFEERWARGNFDQGRLDRAIENLDHLARAQQLNYRDREVLRRNMSVLRDLRSNGSDWYRR